MCGSSSALGPVRTCSYFGRFLGWPVFIVNNVELWDQQFCGVLLSVAQCVGLFVHRSQINSKIFFFLFSYLNITLNLSARS